MRRWWLGVLLVLGASFSVTHAYVRSTASSSNSTPIAWDLANQGTFLTNVVAGQVEFRLHGAGSDDIGDGSDLEAVESAFRTWNGITGSALAFIRGADTVNTTTVMDQEFPIFWTESSTTLDQGTATPDDDVSVAGALAVTFTYRYTSGSELGDIVDANIVFNGMDHTWTTDTVTYPDRFDVESVALHEIGHALGLDHSPVAASTMFPRTRAGDVRQRTLSPDDAAATRAAYPGGNTAANRGAVTGALTSDTPVFGGIVWARDAVGVVSGQAIAQADGSFRIDGLAPGDYELFARPTSDPSGFSLFAESNLGGIYFGLNRSFRPTKAFPAVVDRGQTTNQDLTALPGSPPMDVLLIGRSGWYSNSGTYLRRGETGITVGVAGPGLPATGAPLSVSGPGVTVTQTLFGTVAGYPAIIIRVDIAANAPIGPRDLVVDDGLDTTTAIGGLEILFADSPGAPAPTGALGLEVVGPALDLNWAPAAGADGYRLYRGPLAALTTGTYDHVVADGGCWLSVPDASLFADLTDGLDHYYLVAGVNPAGAAHLGSDSAGVLRPMPAPACP